VRLRLIPIPGDNVNAPLLAPVLFSMVSRELSSSNGHFSKATQYTIDAQFSKHLQTCPLCRQQMIDGLTKTADMIAQGNF